MQNKAIFPQHSSNLCVLDKSVLERLFVLKSSWIAELFFPSFEENYETCLTLG